MSTLARIRPLVLAVAFVALGASAARAQSPKFELGTTLMGVTIGLGDNDVTTVGIPSSGFGLISPSVYGSFFMGSRLAVEPQLGFIYVSDGDSAHIANVGGQVDYFLTGLHGPYVFGAASVIDSTGDETMNSVGAGVGYRVPVGDRLAFRLDGRYLHFSDNGGNALTFGISIGGVFGK